MTETSPLGVMNTCKATNRDLQSLARDALAVKQGRPVPGVDIKITDDNDNELPWDGQAFGALKVRRPWVCSDYYRLDGGGGVHDADGWLETGDVATVDADGYVKITDRSKDLIKSGGEWISSIDLESVAVGHPGVRECAVVGMAHPEWQERPLLVVVPSAAGAVTREEPLEWFKDKVAKWWIPDDVAFVDELPHTATGKISKLKLRERFDDYQFPNATA